MIKQVELTEEQKKKIEKIRQTLYEGCKTEEEYEIKKMAVFGYVVKEFVEDFLTQKIKR